MITVTIIDDGALVPQPLPAVTDTIPDELATTEMEFVVDDPVQPTGSDHA